MNEIFLDLVESVFEDWQLINAQALVTGKILIKESRLPEYAVSIIVQGQPAEIKISGYSRTSVLSIARKLFGKNTTITGSVRLV